MEEYLQTEWPHLQVYVNSITEQFTTFNISGPKSREIMSKVFKRPMFRGGGNVNTGILSGIRDNFSNGTPSERIAKAREEFSKPAFDPVAQLLIQGGLSGFSQTGGGSTAATHYGQSILSNYG